MSIKKPNSNKLIQVTVEEGDAMVYEADYLILKYAQNYYGLDRMVANRLIDSGIEKDQIAPKIGENSIVKSTDDMGVKNVLFMGVVPVFEFMYQEIRKFSRDILVSLSRSTNKCKTILLTIHGVGYGLDEVEVFKAEIAGLIDGITDNKFPKDLEKITIIDRNRSRVKLLNYTLASLLPKGYIEINLHNYLKGLEINVSEQFRSVGYASDNKPHIFVAMPFKDEMYDTYNFGISGAVRDAGYLCERADLESFTGDVMQWVKKRIKSSTLVIADLSGANANVYLEVGYAWGVGIPTILIIKNTEKLKFDVINQRCIIYKNITDLKGKLQLEVSNLLKNQSNKTFEGTN